MAYSGHWSSLPALLTVSRSLLWEVGPALVFWVRFLSNSYLICKWEISQYLRIMICWLNWALVKVLCASHKCIIIWTFSELKIYIFLWNWSDREPKNGANTLLQNLYNKIFICKYIFTQSLDFQPHFCARIPSICAKLWPHPNILADSWRLNSNGSHFCATFRTLPLSKQDQSLICLPFVFRFWLYYSSCLFMYNFVRAVYHQCLSHIEWMKVYKLHKNTAILKESTVF